MNPFSEDDLALPRGGPSLPRGSLRPSPLAQAPGVSSHTRTTTHEIERYAGLFAQRTRVMRSSAMRDLMALTARADVISLAGGLPDTSTFPPGSYAG